MMFLEVVVATLASLGAHYAVTGDQAVAMMRPLNVYTLPLVIA